MMIPERQVEAVKSYCKPVTKKGLRGLIGLVSYYRWYLEMLAEETAILSPATSKSAPSRVVWMGEKERAFTHHL